MTSDNIGWFDCILGTGYVCGYKTAHAVYDSDLEAADH